MYNKIQEGALGKLRMIKLTARELPGTTWKEYIMASGEYFIREHPFNLKGGGRYGFLRSRNIFFSLRGAVEFFSFYKNNIF